MMSGAADMPSDARPRRTVTVSGQRSVTKKAPVSSHQGTWGVAYAGRTATTPSHSPNDASSNPKHATHTRWVAERLQAGQANACGSGRLIKSSLHPEDPFDDDRGCSRLRHVTASLLFGLGWLTLRRLP